MTKEIPHAELLKNFEKKIKYKFKNKDLLVQALTHSSFAKLKHNKGLSDNERLEFLGDAVLKLLMTEVLYDTYPDENEGNLSKWRSRLVSDKYLASLAHSIDLGEYMQFSFGEKRSGGDSRPSNLANAFEALLGACYLDSGFKQCQTLLKTVLSYHPPETLKNLRLADYKTVLQELMQSKHLPLPKYKVIKESGPEHKKCFISHVTINLDDKERYFEGKGDTKKESEQVAAKEALDSLN